MNMTLEEIKIHISLVDAGIKATGIQAAQNGGFAHLQSALDKLNAMADVNNKTDAE